VGKEWVVECIELFNLYVSLKTKYLLINKMTNKNVLEEAYKESERPYSQNELKAMRTELYNQYRLSKVEAQHNHCGHFYKVRKNGRKEKEILENNNSDTGNCSICWKLNKIKDNYCREIAKDVIYDHSKFFYNVDNVDSKFLTYFMVNTEMTYYKWLYEDTRNFQKEKNTEIARGKK